MKKLINTRIKKIWIAWFCFYLGIIFTTILIGKFLTSNKIISNIFFGYIVLSLFVLLFAYFKTKQKSNVDLLEDRVVLDYFQKDYKIDHNSRALVYKKRIIYIACYGVITLSINLLISLIFTYV